MIRALAMLAAAAMLATACVSSAHEAAPTFAPQPLPAQTYPSPLAAAAAVVGPFPETLEGGSTMTLAMEAVTGSADRLALTVAVAPLLDDSVQAQEWRLELRRAGSGWQIVALGLRQKCARGAVASQWIAAPCP